MPPPAAASSARSATDTVAKVGEAAGAHSSSSEDDQQEDYEDEEEGLLLGSTAAEEQRALLATEREAQLLVPPLRTTTLAALRRRRRAEVLGMARLNVGVALLNAGYWPTEMLKTPLFAAVGYNSSALIYLFFGLFAFFTPMFVAKVGVARVIALGSVPYLLFGLSTEMVLYVMGDVSDPRWSQGGAANTLAAVVYYMASILLGMAASPLRTGSSIYVRARAMGYDRARAPAEGAHRTKNSLGTFAGINNAAFGVSSFVFVTLVGRAIQAGTSFTFLFWCCAGSIAVSMPLIFTIPSSESISRRHPIGKASLAQEREDEVLLPTSVGMCAVCELLRRSTKLRWLLVPAVSSMVQSSYFVGSFGADVIAKSVGLEWVGWCEAIQIVMSSLISPAVGRLSDIYGRMLFYYTGLSLNILSAIYVSCVGASSWTPAKIVAFSLVRGFAGSTMAVTQAIYSEEFDDAESNAAMSAFTMSAMTGSSIMFAIGPYFDIEAKSLMVALLASCAGVAVWMAIGRRDGCKPSAARKKQACKTGP